MKSKEVEYLNEINKKFDSKPLDESEVMLLLYYANRYKDHMQKSGKMNIDDCLDLISKTIKGFLAEEGGYNNGYYTYVDGKVSVGKEGFLNWSTPKAGEEFTPIGIKNRGEKLYLKVQDILKEFNLKEVVIRHKDVNYGAMETEVVYIDETSKLVLL